MNNCQAYRAQDEYHCALCGMQWAVDEPKPDCRTEKQRDLDKAKQARAEIRRLLEWDT